MSENLGSGVTRTLSALKRQFMGVVWQDQMPPDDCELNLMAQIDVENLRQQVRALMPSGFLMDPTRALADYLTDADNANFFGFGNTRHQTDGAVVTTDENDPVIWANVNGWLIPVAGTDQGELPWGNLLRLNPPPETGTRVDLVFLEAWLALVAPNPSTVNKPEASKVFKYGNVQQGGTNIDDDIQSPHFGFETTERVQLQYRLRVFGYGQGAGAGATLDVYPDGLGDPRIFGQGAATAPGALPFVNMRAELGDPALWRAGDGDSTNGLGTVDGYTYAIPVCAVFRRNSDVFTAVVTGGTPTQNGAFNRTHSAVSTADARGLVSAILTAPLAPTDLGTIPLGNFFDSGLDDPWFAAHPTSTFLVIDDEIVGLSAIDQNAGTVTIASRGRYGTNPTLHAAGVQARFYNTRPDGLFADQIAATDILDLRRAVNPGDWDYHRLLEHNVAALATGGLRTAWKKMPASDTQGVTLPEVDFLYAGPAVEVPDHTEQIDGPDGIRMIWSDGAVIQPDVTCLLDNGATLSDGTIGFQSNETFDGTTKWDVGPDFWPIGFINKAQTGVDAAWYNGSIILFHIGGETGSQGARGTVPSTDNKVVRFLTPAEWWKSGYPIVDPQNGNQHPISLRFLAERAHEPPVPVNPNYSTRHPGPMYPWQTSNFEYPFIVLGSRLRSEWRKTDLLVTNTLFNEGSDLEIETGLDFDADGVYAVLGDDGRVDPVLSLNPANVSRPVSRNERTLFDLLTDGGRDLTGSSSQVYVVVYGDPLAYQNNGAFRVIGVGTKGYTLNDATAGTRLNVIPLSADFAGGFQASPGSQVTFEIRSPLTHADDLIGGGSYQAKSADLCLVLTDIGGSFVHPWQAEALGSGEPSYDLSMKIGNDGRPYADSKMLISTTLQYHPGRGGTKRVADAVMRFARTQGDPSNGAYLRQSPSNLDTSFSGLSGAPAAEAFYDPCHVQTWNRLPALGWPAGPNAPTAPGTFGGNVVGYTEQDREHELFFDAGSKTLIWRPFRSRLMTMQALSYTDLLVQTSLIGNYTYPNNKKKDALQLFTGSDTTGKQMGFVVPREFMPRFGRQDIPYYSSTGNSPEPFLPGINHLFRDSNTLADPVYNVIGGEDNAGAAEVLPMYFETGMAVGYSDQGTIITPAGNDTPCYAARKVPVGINPAVQYADGIIAKLKAVHSSDFGAGLKGIQLPPYLGIARLYGVYDKRDFEAQGGRTFGSDRKTPDPSGATNLLRRDATRQTLFLLQDGARDLTQETDDHTYIVPLEAFDITRSPFYAEGDTFESLEFVVECAVFGFAKGFINQNNLVLCRKHDGQGNLNEDGADGGKGAPVPQLEDVGMVIPCPAEANQQAYIVYNRTVYQGDVYGTRYGASRTFGDYTARYGQVPPTSAAALAHPIRQFDDNGDPIPQTPNARTFEVLASLDFYSTMGTGKVGGLLYPGTMLDVGFTQPVDPAHPRIPSAEAETTPWRVLSRAFTEGQKANDSRAALDVVLLSNDLNPSDTNCVQFKLGLLDGSTLTFWAAKLVNQAAVEGLGVPSTDIFTVDATATTDFDAEVLTASSFASAVNNHPALQRSLRAWAEGPRVHLEAIPVGAEGNGISVSLTRYGSVSLPLPALVRLLGPHSNERPMGAQVTRSNLLGGIDLPMNAGNGTSQLKLTGMTERLPLGILLSDSDFLCENPLCDAASAMQTSPAGVRPIQTPMPLTSGGVEFTRFTGAPGEFLGMADGSVLVYDAFDTSPLGAKSFRLYRGGGSAFMLSGDAPGGPIDWVSGSFPASVQPVLKGGLLACKALLVRNFRETPFAQPAVVSEGDEIQMVVLTSGIFGDGHSQQEGVTLGGVVSPTGYGEGYSAADRYRIEGRPMVRGYNRQVDPDPASVTLAAYPEQDRRA